MAVPEICRELGISTATFYARSATVTTTRAEKISAGARWPNGFAHVGDRNGICRDHVEDLSRDLIVPAR